MEEEQIVFFRNLYDSFLSLDVDVNTYIIWGGDFNCHLDKEDADGGACSLKIKSINIINTINEDLELTEIWRVRNPNVKRFTWRIKSPLLQRRLDYYLISSQLQFVVTSCDIIPAEDTDHSAITLKLKSLPDVPKGPSHWHFNNSLVKEETYIQLMREHIGLWIQECNDEYKDNNDARKLWEFLKYKIRSFTIEYTKNKAKSGIVKVNQLESSLTGNTNTTLRKEYDDAKLQLEQYYDEITRGIIVRSRVQWVEDGEKSTKYFLNMEKRNQIKKSVKKLVINKDEVENPHLILRELKRYFMHKYSRKVNVNPESCDLFLDTIATPVLTQNDLQLCEGLITEGEVYTALTSMKNNKSPGNDGLSKEFYICFYPELKDHLVNCLNSCYYYGLLSNSQKQAIIRLIEKPGKDIRFVKNWHLISLINVDAKVLKLSMVIRVLLLKEDL